MLTSRAVMLAGTAVALAGLGLARPTVGQAQGTKDTTDTDRQYADWVATYGNWTPAKAQQAGYLPTDVCVTATAVGLPASSGAMGRHFVHPAYIEDGKADADAPDIVLFDAQDRAVGLEFEILTVVDPIPSVAGLPLERTPADPGVDQEHLSLHVYFVGDSADRYKTFNPAVRCSDDAAPAEAPSIGASTAPSASLPSALPAAVPGAVLGASPPSEPSPTAEVGAVVAAFGAERPAAGPADAAREDAAPGDAAPDDAAPGDAAPGDAARGGAAQDDPAHRDGVRAEAAPDMPGAGVGDLLPGGNTTLLGLVALVLVGLAAAGRLAARRA